MVIAANLAGALEHLALLIGPVSDLVRLSEILKAMSGDGLSHMTPDLGLILSVRNSDEVAVSNAVHAVACTAHLLVDLVSTADAVLKNVILPLSNKRSFANQPSVIESLEVAAVAPRVVGGVSLTTRGAHGLKVSQRQRNCGAACKTDSRASKALPCLAAVMSDLSSCIL